MSDKVRKNAGININPQKDKDIIDWINSQSNYGQSIKMLIRREIKRSGNQDIFQLAYEKVDSEPVIKVIDPQPVYQVNIPKEEPKKTIPQPLETPKPNIEQPQVTNQEDEDVADGFEI